MVRKYGFIRIIGSIFRLLGIAAAILAVAVPILLFFFAQDGWGANLNAFNFGPSWSSPYVEGGLLVILAFIIFCGLVFALGLYAVGQGFYLFLAIEENTRYSSKALTHIVQPGQDDLAI